MLKSLHFLLCCIVALTVSCQAAMPPPTLQPGEVEVSFETLVLDEEGATEITQGPELLTLMHAGDTDQLKALISPEAFQQVQQVDFDVYSVLALFRVPGSGCSLFGVTIERLVRRANALTIQAYDWRPSSGGACAQTSRSAYHLIKVRKVEANLNDLELILQIQGIERPR